jgi:hypothetical protein
MSIKPLWLGVAALACLVVASGAQGAATTVRSYGLPGGGSLELEVPIRWQEEIGWSEQGERPTVTFRPESGGSFLVRITVLVPEPDAGAAFASSDRLRGLVEGSARASLGLDGGADLHLESIGDETHVVGWYYSVVDSVMPDPPPEGTFRVMTQGASAASGFVLTATVLTQKQSGDDLNDAIAMLRTARVGEGPGDAWRVPGRIVKAHGALGQRYALDLPEGFEVTSRAPLEARHLATGALLSIDVVDRDSKASARDELRRIEADLERRSPGAVLLRRRGVSAVAGRTAANVEAVDELRDEHVRIVAIPLADATLVLSWRVHPSRAGVAAAALDDVLAGLTLKAD